MKSKDKLIFTEEIENRIKDEDVKFIVGKKYDLEYKTSERYTFDNVLYGACYQVKDENGNKFLFQDIDNGILFNIIKM